VQFKLERGTFMKKIILLISSLSLFMLVGCTQNISPNTYTTSQVGVAGKVLPGEVVAKRIVTVDNSSGVGGAAGVLAGGAAGAAIGGSTEANIVGAVGGALIGGVVGNAIDKSVTRKQAYEYVIKLDNGSTVSIAQSLEVELAVHQRVLVMYGAMTRVVPDTTPPGTYTTSKKSSKTSA
jgi:outer membrane lipoprotein SlyB